MIDFDSSKLNFPFIYQFITHKYANSKTQIQLQQQTGTSRNQRTQSEQNFGCFPAERAAFCGLCSVEHRITTNEAKFHKYEQIDSKIHT